MGAQCDRRAGHREGSVVTGRGRDSGAGTPDLLGSAWKGAQAVLLIRYFHRLQAVELLHGETVR